MTCENCGAPDAKVHLTQIIKSEMSTHHLCEKCAAAKGLDTTPEVSLPLMDVFSKIVPEVTEDPSWGTEACSFCGLTHKDFKRTGRLGCAHCYETFKRQLPAMLQRVHGSARHVGKVYLPPDPTASETERRLEGLRRMLERAVQSEEFERAAQLRDQIRELEPV